MFTDKASKQVGKHSGEQKKRHPRKDAPEMRVNSFWFSRSHSDFFIEPPDFTFSVFIEHFINNALWSAVIEEVVPLLTMAEIAVDAFPDNIPFCAEQLAPL